MKILKVVLLGSCMFASVLVMGQNCKESNTANATTVLIKKPSASYSKVGTCAQAIDVTGLFSVQSAKAGGQGCCTPSAKAPLKSASKDGANKNSAVAAAKITTLAQSKGAEK
jgi:hypothetical protein